jgi:regulator of replication initiation timing
MPTVNPQGSRTGLILWTVITSFLSVLSVILVIYFYLDADSARKQSDQLRSKYAKAVAEGELNSPAVSALYDAANSGTDPTLNSSMTGIQIALTQRDNLARKIAGQAAAEDPNSAARATSAADTSIKRAIDRLKLDAKALPSENLAGAIDTLASTLGNRQQEVATLNEQLKSTQDRLDKTLADTQAQIKQMTDTMEQVRKEQQDAVSNVSSVTASKDEQVQSISSDYEKQLAALREQVSALQTVNEELGGRNRQLEIEVDKVRARLSEVRIDPTQAVTRQADGKIIRLPGGNVAFIDLGAGDHVTPGLTFEVFDKVDGIPQAGDASTEENLPAGKASLEVVRVSPTTSECRITRLAPGQTLSEGDLIANLVYDRNTTYNFLVYGNFDLDRNGVATPQDAEVIKRLITQWGGNVAAELNVDTDFVVLGKEPEIPTISKEERDVDPVLKAKYDAAVAESEAYAEISAKAREYRIPILNQNRFLYLIGYFDQARR